MDTTCIACHRTIPPWDLPRYACQGCQQRTSAQLAELPELYRQLDPAPGRGGPRVGSRHGTAAEPLRLDVIDLTGARGHVLTVLSSWIRCWAEDGAGDLPEWPAGEHERVTAACRWLRWRLDWAARQHPAVDDAMHEVRHLHGQLRAALGEERERRIAVSCPCGSVLRVTVNTHGATCGGCGQRYGRTEALALPLAARAAAA